MNPSKIGLGMLAFFSLAISSALLYGKIEQSSKIKNMVDTVSVAKDSIPSIPSAASVDTVVMDDYKYDFPCIINGRQVYFQRQDNTDNDKANILIEVKANGDTLKYWSYNKSSKIQYIDIIHFRYNDDGLFGNNLKFPATKGNKPITITYNTDVKEEFPIIQRGQAHADSLLEEILRQKVKAGHELMK